MNIFTNQRIKKLTEMMIAPPGVGEWRFCVTCFRPYWSYIEEVGASWGDAEHHEHTTVVVPRLFKNAAARDQHFRDWLNSKDCPLDEEQVRSVVKVLKENGYDAAVRQSSAWRSFRYLTLRQLLLQRRFYEFFSSISMLTGERPQTYMPVAPRGYDSWDPDWAEYGDFDIEF